MYKPLWDKIVDGVDGARLCVGIDPHLSILEDWIDTNPELFIGLENIIKEAGSGITDENGTILPANDISNLNTHEKLQNPEYAGYAAAIFAGIVIDSVDETNVVAIKPQSAFFEQFGSKGIVALESVLQVAKMREIPIILDVKRGDIGSTMQGYANAYLGDNGLLTADAITVSPYLGIKSIKEMADFANKNRRGIFILCLTSNEGAADFQLAKVGDSDKTIAKEVFDFAQQYNAENGVTIGLVVGATIKDTAVKAGIDFTEFNGPILCPGVGAQGGSGADIVNIFGGAKYKVLPSVSREILNIGPDVNDLAIKTADICEKLYDEINS